MAESGDGERAKAPKYVKYTPKIITFPKTKKYSFANISWTGLPLVYMPCPHLHFRAETINRAMLTPEEHIELLATPKGYRWDTMKPRKFRFPVKRKGQLRKGKGGGTMKDRRYINDFLGELWSILTPEMLACMKKLLVDEFGMTPNEAEDFINEQRAKSVPRRKPSYSCDKYQVGVRHYWIKEFTKVLAQKLTDYVVMMLCARRTKRVRKIAEAILGHLCDITGEQCTLSTPQTRVQRIMVFAADRLAIWLAGMVAEAEKVPPPPPVEAPPAEGAPTEGAPTEGAPTEGAPTGQPPAEGSKPPSKPSSKPASKPGSKPESKPGSRGASAPSSKPASKPASQPASKPASQPASAQASKPPSKPASQPTSAPSTKPASKSPSAPASKTPSKPPSKPESTASSRPASAAGSKPASAAASKPGSVQPSKAPSKGSSEASSKLESAEPSALASAAASELAVPSAEEPIPSGEPTAPPSEEPSAPPTEEPSAEGIAEGLPTGVSPAEGISALPSEAGVPGEAMDAAEMERMKGAKRKSVMDHVVTWVEDTVPAESDRQRALDGTIKGMLRGEIRDTDDLTKTAIDEVSAKLSTWVDKMATEAEVAAGLPRKPGKKSVVYHIKKGDCNFYEVKQVSSHTVAEKVALARGRVAGEWPTHLDNRPANLNAVTPQEMKDWAEWAVDVVAVAEQWASWIDKTVSDAENKAKRKKGLISGPALSKAEWQQFQEETQQDAIDWRKSKKMLKETATMWDEKAKKAQNK